MTPHLIQEATALMTEAKAHIAATLLITKATNTVQALKAPTKFQVWETARKVVANTAAPAAGADIPCRTKVLLTAEVLTKDLPSRTA